LAWLGQDALESGAQRGTHEGCVDRPFPSLSSFKLLKSKRLGLLRICRWPGLAHYVCDCCSWERTFETFETTQTSAYKPVDICHRHDPWTIAANIRRLVELIWVRFPDRKVCGRGEPKELHSVLVRIKDAASIAYRVAELKNQGSQSQKVCWLTLDLMRSTHAR
jgi:hypothetical protein